MQKTQHLTCYLAKLRAVQSGQQVPTFFRSQIIDFKSGATAKDFCETINRKLPSLEMVIRVLP